MMSGLSRTCGSAKPDEGCVVVVPGVDEVSGLEARLLLQTTTK